MCAHSSLPWSRSPKPAHSDVGISFFFFVGDVSPCGTILNVYTRADVSACDSAFVFSRFGSGPVSDL